MLLQHFTCAGVREGSGSAGTVLSACQDQLVPLDQSGFHPEGSFQQFAFPWLQWITAR